MNRLSFLKEGVRTIRTTGAVAHSSKYLCAGMLRPVNFSGANVIVEMGAGDGALTRRILAKMKPDAVLLCFEINPMFCKLLREIKDERFILIEDSAEFLDGYLKKNGLPDADYIISGIPFIALPRDCSYRIVRSAFKGLKVGGSYIQFHYATILKRMYQTIFGNLTIRFIPLNLPPAFVMVCVKH